MVVESPIRALVLVIGKMSVLFVQMVEKVVIRFTMAITTVAVVSKQRVITTIVEVSVDPRSVAN